MTLQGACAGNRGSKHALHTHTHTTNVTHTGVHELEKGGVRAAYMGAVVAATNRANELSRM